MDKRSSGLCTEVSPRNKKLRHNQHYLKILKFTRDEWDGGSHQRTTFARDCVHLLHLLHSLGPRHCKF